MIENTYQHLGPKTLPAFMVYNSGPFFGVLFLNLGLIFIQNYFTQIEIIAQYTELLSVIIFIGWIMLGIILAITVLVSWLQYVCFLFMLDANSFKIKRGVLTTQETAIPYRQIKSVDIKQTLLYQLLGVSRITIETIIDTGHLSDFKADHDDEVLPIVEANLAKIIQHELTARANVQKMNVS